MLKHKNIDKISFAVLAFTLALAILFIMAASGGVIEANDSVGYENRLFDTSRVHSIDIVMDDWEGFLETCASEAYSSATIVIDGEKYGNVGIRGKGNTSLSQVAAYGNDRYSFKVEFDHYSDGRSYYGLDKLSLNNLISDNTYMKDYLTYQMMNDMGVAAPLCSFVQISVNGEVWGLYLAVEGVEDGFLQRNYSSDYGELYKPDSMGFGGGRGNGAEFNMEDFANRNIDSDNGADSASSNDDGNWGGRGGGGMGGGMGAMGSSDVYLQYTDDDPASYSNIFNNAKTDVTEADQSRLIASLKQLDEGENIGEVVDVDAVIRYLVVHNFVCNSDSYTGSMVHNYYLYEEDGVLTMLPWDYNLAFGGMGGMGMGGGTTGGATSEVNSPIDSPVTSGTLESRPMVSWIFESEEYTALYHQYYGEFMEKYFNSGYFEEMMDKTVVLISPYVESDPTAFCSYEEFLTGVETLREFCLLRAQSVSGQLEGGLPSTQEEQSADSSALIDASHISISDMGTFSGGGGGGRSNMPGGGERPTGGGPPENGGNFEMPADLEGFDPSAMFGEASSGASASNGSQQWILLGASALLLLLGLLVAKLYRSNR